MIKQLFIRNIPVFAVGSLTLGLAPFLPEPHIWEKIRWIATGQKMDLPIYWWDMLMHGAPWLLLIIGLILKATDKRA